MYVFNICRCSCRRFCSPLKSSARMIYSFRGTREPLNDPRVAHDLVMSLRQEERVVLFRELDFVLNKSVSEAEPAPTSAVLRKVTVNNIIPFIGFGFLDNLVMIMAGDIIDKNIGVLLGISTLAAAAWGNLISDVFGLALAGYIEGFAVRFGMTTPDITPKQADMFVTRFAAAIGRTIGIVLGCLIGMTPLLFLSVSQ
ncbi:transmembrane protein 65-like [Convolutriloba macropyga]|uniref:transmembrane protein 65-like n=1 Tax=Convolutriloba macropyga TaxID=536237 RepID=UPI003F51E0DD